MNTPARPQPVESVQRPVVLCVDDESPVLGSLHRLLRDEPYDLLTTDRPEEALDWVRHRPIRVLVADQRMPGMKGTDLLKAARAASPTTRRMMLTAVADYEVLSEAVNEAGIQRLLYKPWNGEDLKETIRSLIGERRHPAEDDPGTVKPDVQLGSESATHRGAQPSALRIHCPGKDVDEILHRVGLVLLTLRPSDREVSIILEDLMSLDDSVSQLLVQLVRTLFKSGTRVTVNFQLRRDHFGE